MSIVGAMSDVGVGGLAVAPRDTVSEAAGAMDVAPPAPAPGAEAEAATPVVVVTGAITIQCIRDRAGLDSLAEAWDRLASRLERPTLFQSYAWNMVWLDTLGSKGRPWVLVARDAAGGVVGIAPLWARNQARRPHLRFIGDYLGENNDFMIDRDRPEAMDTLLRWLAEHRRAWRSMVLVHLLEGAQLLAALPTQLTDHGVSCRRYPFGEAPTCIFKAPGDARSIASKRDIKAKYRKLSAEAEVTFLHLREPAEIKPLLRPFYDMHILRWGSTPTPSRFLSADQCAFHDRLVEVLAPRGEVMLSLLKADGRLIAFHLGLIDGARLISYCPCFDPAMGPYSPSMILLRSLFEYCGDHGFSELDFSGGNEAYKYRFSNEVRQLCEVRAFASNHMGRIDHLKQRIRIHLRESDRLKHWTKTALAKLPRRA